MIDIAVHATEGVMIPNRKQTHKAIIELFKANLTKLRARLNVRSFFRRMEFIQADPRAIRVRQYQGGSILRAMHGKL